jgi:Signal peptidase (SPase) II
VASSCSCTATSRRWVGAAFGAGARCEPLLAAAGLAGVVLLGLWATKASSLAERSGAALAADNLLDRLARPPSALHGGVVDWLHVSFYGPTFNLADLRLRGGLLIAAGAWLWQHRRQAGVPARFRWRTPPPGVSRGRSPWSASLRRQVQRHRRALRATASRTGGSGPIALRHSATSPADYARVFADLREPLAAAPL